MTKAEVHALYEGIAKGSPQLFDFQTLIMPLSVVFVVLSVAFYLLIKRHIWLSLVTGVVVTFSVYGVVYVFKYDAWVERERDHAYRMASLTVIEDYIPTLDTVSYPVTEYALLSIEDVQEGDDVPVRATITRKGLQVETEEIVVVRFADVDEPTMTYRVLEEDLVYGDHIPDEYVVRAGEYHPVLTLPEGEEQ